LQELIKAALIAMGVCLLCGPILIPFLRRLKFGQSIRSEGPQAHLQKTGTPTMGGVMFFLSLTAAVAFTAGFNGVTVVLLLITVAFGCVGLLDDFIKVVLKRPLGLRAREKLLAQVLISGVFAYIIVAYGGRGTDLIIPGTAWVLPLGWFYIPFVVFMMVGFNNAVNLTDGLDGLAAGVTLFAALAYALIANAWGLHDVSLFAAALVGTCLGFLFFNIHPARVFMGDTGSLALGGAVFSLAVLTKTELLFLIIGGVFVLETLSVIIQVIYFRVTGGKRFFRMSPLHHHFELSGWSEQRVVFTFWAMAALCACLGVVLIL